MLIAPALAVVERNSPHIMESAAASPLIVRPLRDGEERLFHGIAGDPATLDARTERLVAYRAANPGLNPACRLLAFRGGQVIGRLSGMICDPRTYVLQQLDVAADEAESDVVAALFGSLHEWLPRWTFEAITWRRVDDEPLHRRFTTLGFTVRLDKAFYRRALPADDLRSPDPLVYRSFADLGRDAFLAVFRCVYANLVDGDFGDPESDLASHIAFAGPAFSPARWLAGYFDEQPVGYVLPQVYPDVPTEGSLFSLGVAPVYRGRGLGRILHARGLADLSAAGATGYAGSTDVRNAAMIRIFLANGCRKVGTRRIYRLSDPPDTSGFALA